MKSFLAPGPLLTLALWLAGLPLFPQQFKASASSPRVGLGERFRVDFLLEGAATPARPSFPDFGDFQLLGGPSTSTSMSIINGNVSQSITWSFYFQGKRKGSFTLAPASVEINGKPLKSNSLTIEITEAGSPPPPQAGGQAPPPQALDPGQLDAELAKKVFIRAIPSKSRVHQGEQITVVYKLYEQVSVTNLQPKGMPAYAGFWHETVNVSNQLPQNETWQGQNYRTRIIKQDVLFPQRSGRLSIEPLEVRGVVQVPVRGGRAGNIFDSFFGRYEPYTYDFGSAPVSIEVQPLPEPLPANFAGLSGTLSLQGGPDKERLNTGEALTYRIQLEGQGNLKQVSLPRPAFPPDFEVYDPTSEDNYALVNGQYGGKRSVSYLLIPRNPGSFRIPALSLSYFDPAQRRYVERTLPEASIEVGGQPLPVSASAGGASLETLNEDIRYLQTAAGLRRQGQGFAASALHLVLLVLPLLALGALVWLRRRQLAELRDAEGTRSRKAGALARSRLRQAEALLASGKPQEFYQEISRTLWAYLSDKFRLPASQLSRERVAAELASRGHAPGIAEGLVRLLDTCETALYAPPGAGQGRESVYQEALSLLTRIEEQSPL